MTTGDAPCRLTFLVPLRPRAQTEDWPLVSRLCMATLRSCLQNPAPGIRVVLVGHDAPEGFDTIGDPRIQFLPTDTRLPIAFEGSAGMQDKWTKIFRGLVEIAGDPPDYFMFVDADDLVSARLYDFLNDSRPPNGVICKDGYRYEMGSRSIKLIRGWFNCGTNAIIATQAVVMPTEVSKAARERCVALRVGHMKIEAEMAQIGSPLIRVPFPSVVYIMHAEQHTRAGGAPDGGLTTRIKSHARKVRQYMRDRRHLHDAAEILGEFGMPPGSVPRRALSRRQMRDE